MAWIVGKQAADKICWMPKSSFQRYSMNSHLQEQQGEMPWLLGAGCPYLWIMLGNGTEQELTRFLVWLLFGLLQLWIFTFLLGFKDVGQRLGSQMGNFTINNEHLLRMHWDGSTTLWAPSKVTGQASARNPGDLGSIPGLGRSPGEGNGTPLQHSCLENPMDRGAW